MSKVPTIPGWQQVSHAVATQSRLADSVAEQAKQLSPRMHVRFWLARGTLPLILQLPYSSLPPWGGYGIGSGQAQLPALLLGMLIGFLIGSLCFCCGIGGGVLTAKDFSQGYIARRKRLPSALSAAPGDGLSVSRRAGSAYVCTFVCLVSITRMGYP